MKQRQLIFRVSSTGGGGATDKAKREALAAGAVAAELFVDCVNGGVQEVFINEKRIEQEARALKDTVQRFAQQSNQWLTVFNEFDSALKVQCNPPVLKSPLVLLKMAKHIFLWSHLRGNMVQEIGDFENWIQVMEKDCEVIGTVLSEISSAPKA